MKICKRRCAYTQKPFTMTFHFTFFTKEGLT